MSTVAVVTERPKDSRVREDESGLSADRAFDVVAPSGLDALSVLYQNTTIQYGTPYKNAAGQVPDPTVRVTEMDVEPRTQAPIGGTGLFTVRVKYARFNRRGSRIPRPGQKTFQWNVSEITGPVDLDIDGYPIVNSQLVPDHLRPEPLPTSSESRVSLIVRYYQSSINLANLLLYANSVNAGNWTVGPYGYVTARQAKCIGIIPEPVQADLWMLTATFEFDAKTWDIRFPDKDSSGKNLNGYGRPITSGLLAGDASNLPAGATREPVYTPSNTLVAVLLRYRKLRELDFNALGI